ncbi:MAG: hypothetical protein HY560_08970 [Gemmatimonadetes bacterium]|nr:hypothetical protein [Gemmatimonadota bacterium]
MRHFLRPGTVRWGKLALLYRLARRRGFLGSAGPPPVYVDNRALDGFLDGLPKGGCRHRDCETCRYCHAWADKVVRIDQEWCTDCQALYQAAFDQMETGGLWA